MTVSEKKFQFKKCVIRFIRFYGWYFYSYQSKWQLNNKDDVNDVCDTFIVCLWIYVWVRLNNWNVCKHFFFLFRFSFFIKPKIWNVWVFFFSKKEDILAKIRLDRTEIRLTVWHICWILHYIYDLRSINTFGWKFKISIVVFVVPSIVWEKNVYSCFLILDGIGRWKLLMANIDNLVHQLFHLDIRLKSLVMMMMRKTKQATKTTTTTWSRPGIFSNWYLSMCLDVWKSLETEDDDEKLDKKKHNHSGWTWSPREKEFQEDKNQKKRLKNENTAVWMEIFFVFRFFLMFPFFTKRYR